MVQRVIIGADHAGFELKEAIKAHLGPKGVEVIDKGTYALDSVDYPDHAHAVAETVANDPDALGILVCGSGNGVNIVANKHEGVRAALAWTPELAGLAKAHNNANVVSLPARFIGTEDGLRIVDAFLATPFEGGRHARRVEKIEPAN